ncbi:MAG: HigA family addiction module antitoxin [Acidobacteriales bacterium]|nr:HigA family addiction module antitoxin [Terriglobales bacterium]
MIKRNRRPTPPGRILVAHYLEPRNLSVSKFAKEIGVSRKHLSDIVNARVRITPSIAVRLAYALGTSAALWVNLQSAVDLFDAEQAYAQRRKASHRRGKKAA